MQTTLKLPAVTRQGRVVLGDISVAMERLNLTRDSVYSLAESGDLRWVWDVTLRPGTIRELRFWVGELVNRRQRETPLETVLGCVIGHERETILSRRTAGDVLHLTPPSIKALVDAGELTPPTPLDNGRVTRKSLEDFLRRRLL